MKILALCLMMIATMWLMTPPSFAWIGEPLFGVDWRPDGCADGSDGFEACYFLYYHVVQLNNDAIDYLWNWWPFGAGCLDPICAVAAYQSYMDSYIPQTCSYYGFWGSGEMNSWCIDLFNVMEASTIAIIGPAGGSCQGACIRSPAAIRHQPILTKEHYRDTR